MSHHCVLEGLDYEGLCIGNGTVEIEDYVTNHILMKTLKEEVEQEDIRYCAKGEGEKEGATEDISDDRDGDGEECHRDV